MGGPTSEISPLSDDHSYSIQGSSWCFYLSFILHISFSFPCNQPTAQRCCTSFSTSWGFRLSYSFNYENKRSSLFWRKQGSRQLLLSAMFLFCYIDSETLDHHSKQPSYDRNILGQPFFSHQETHHLLLNLWLCISKISYYIKRNKNLMFLTPIYLILY